MIVVAYITVIYKMVTIWAFTICSIAVDLVNRSSSGISHFPCNCSTIDKPSSAKTPSINVNTKQHRNCSHTTWKNRMRRNHSTYEHQITFPFTEIRYGETLKSSKERATNSNAKRTPLTNTTWKDWMLRNQRSHNHQLPFPFPGRNYGAKNEKKYTHQNQGNKKKKSKQTHQTRPKHKLQMSLRVQFLITQCFNHPREAKFSD